MDISPQNHGSGLSQRSSAVFSYARPRTLHAATLSLAHVPICMLRVHRTVTALLHPGLLSAPQQGDDALVPDRADNPHHTIESRCHPPALIGGDCTLSEGLPAFATFFSLPRSSEDTAVEIARRPQSTPQPWSVYPRRSRSSLANWPSTGNPVCLGCNSWYEKMTADSISAIEPAMASTLLRAR